MGIIRIVCTAGMTISFVGGNETELPVNCRLTLAAVERSRGGMQITCTASMTMTGP